jgi:hypothetical protein
MPHGEAGVEVGVEGGALAGENGEGGEHVLEIGGAEAVGFGNRSVRSPEIRPKIMIVRDVLN